MKTAAFRLDNTWDLDILSVESTFMAPLLLNLFILLSYPLNFFIYCAMSRQFRDAFCELCCLCCGGGTAAPAAQSNDDATMYVTAALTDMRDGGGGSSRRKSSNTRKPSNV